MANSFHQSKLYEFLSRKLSFLYTCTHSFFLLFMMTSCQADHVDTASSIVPMFVESPEKSIKVNIFYVAQDKKTANTSYTRNEKRFIDFLNGNYFHRFGIGLELASVQTIVNKELYDLRDNEGGEPSTFFMQSRATYEKDKLNIYIIKRENIIGIAGMGRDQRVLLTDTNMYTSTSPHEIGHALGLFHSKEKGNIMNTMKDQRMHFNPKQMYQLRKCIDMINNEPVIVVH